MEKVEVNNQIVVMRKLVRQAKVHAIGKLVRAIRLFKSKRGSEKQIAKFNRKAERLSLELSIIKKISLDDLSKYALSYHKDWREVILQKDSSIEERAKARLCSNKYVQECVQEFYQKFPLLRHQVPEIIQLWMNKSKLPAKPNVIDTNISSNVNGKDGKRSKSFLNDSKSCHEDYDKMCDTLESEKKLQKRKRTTKNITAKGDEIPPDNVLITYPASSQNITPRKEGSLEIKPLNFEGLEDDIFFVGNTKQRSLNDKNENEDLSNVLKAEGGATKHDPFFLGSDGGDLSGDGDNASDVADNDLTYMQSYNKSAEFYKKNLKSKFIGNLSTNSFITDTRGQKTHNTIKRNVDEFVHNRKSNKQSITKIDSKRNSYGRFSAHKHKPNQEHFKKQENKQPWQHGKLISQSPFSRAESGKVSHQFRKNNLSPMKCRLQGAKDFQEEYLHPSWAAKRKLKEQGRKLLPFQGTKIKFDTDE